MCDIQVINAYIYGLPMGQLTLHIFYVRRMIMSRLLILLLEHDDNVCIWLCGRVATQCKITKVLNVSDCEVLWLICIYMIFVDIFQ